MQLDIRKAFDDSLIVTAVVCTGTSCKEIFKLDSLSPGTGFFPIKPSTNLCLKRRRDSDFKSNFRKKVKDITILISYEQFFTTKYLF